MINNKKRRESNQTFTPLSHCRNFFFYLRTPLIDYFAFIFIIRFFSHIFLPFFLLLNNLYFSWREPASRFSLSLSLPPSRSFLFAVPFGLYETKPRIVSQTNANIFVFIFNPARLNYYVSLFFFLRFVNFFHDDNATRERCHLFHSFLFIYLRFFFLLDRR